MERKLVNKNLIIKIILFSLITILIIISLSWIILKWLNEGNLIGKKDNKNIYEYDIEKLKEVDPKLIHYTEINRFNINLKNPSGLKIYSNNIYITGDNKIMIYDYKGNFINQTDLGENAYCLTVDDKIYIGMLDHVEVYDKNLAKINTLLSTNNKSYYSSVAVFKNNLFIADAGNKIIYHFNKQGKLLNEIGGKDTRKGIKGFNIPGIYFDIDVNTDGYLWAVNPGNHSLEKYDFKGNLLVTWDKSSHDITDFVGCCNPAHISVMNNGSIVTCEKGLNRIKVYNNKGVLQSVVAAPKDFTDDTIITDIDVDENNNVFLLDPKLKAVRIFRKKNN